MAGNSVAEVAVEIALEEAKKGVLRPPITIVGPGSTNTRKNTKVAKCVFMRLV